MAYNIVNTNSRKVKVKNRSNSIVIYKVDDLNVRREFAPGEVKMIPVDELYALSQKRGGANIIANSLFISDPATVKEMPMKVEPEYYLDDNGVIDLLKNGSVDALLDCLDFAPSGVISLVQKYAVELPLTDTRKIKAIQEKTGFKVDLALKHKEELAAEEAEAANQTDSGMEVKATTRRVQQAATEEEPTGRRTTPKYNVVSTKI
jgi:hypothetical protein